MKVYLDKECIEVDEAVAEEFAAKFQQINAGGGIVRNSKGETLMILRHGIWDLPKGKQEPGESIEECALREVEEETGLKGLTLGELHSITHHTYKVFGTPVLKHTYWFDMTYAGDATPTPQQEEDITRVEWVSDQDLPAHLATTYPSILDALA